MLKTQEKAYVVLDMHLEWSEMLSKCIIFIMARIRFGVYAYVFSC